MLEEADNKQNLEQTEDQMDVEEHYEQQDEELCQESPINEKSKGGHKEFSKEECFLAALNLLNIMPPNEQRQEIAEWLNLKESSAVAFPNKTVVGENGERLINDAIKQ